jgi:hypothetical protein
MDQDRPVPTNPRDATHSGVSIAQSASHSEAMALQQRRQNDVVSKSGRGVPLPGGVVAPLDAFAGIESLPTTDHRKYLAEPEKYVILAPTPGSRYAWASRDDKYGGDTTSGAIRSGRYRPVKKSEIKDDVDFDIHFKTGTGTNQYVCWRDCMLVEIPERYARIQYDGPIAEYIRHLGVQQDQFRAGVEKQSGGLAVGVAGQALTRDS